MPKIDSEPGSAELVLLGGTVHSMAGMPVPASAVAVRDGRVLCLGTDADMLAVAGPGTQVIDLAGRAVVPGINDAHLHATWLGAMWPATVFGETGEGRQAARLPDERARRRAILKAGDLLASLGITSYTEPGIGPGEDAGETGAFGSAVARTYRRLASEGLLRARVTALSLFGELDGPSDRDTFLDGIAALEPESGTSSLLRFVGVKIFADGIPPMRTAYTRQSYQDGTRASLLVAGADDGDREDNLEAMISAAHRGGLQVAIHATGDRSIDLMIEAVEKARAQHDVELGHYVIHGDMVTTAQLDRMASGNIGLSTQAGIATRTHEFVERALGAGRGSTAWPLRAALDAGVNLCLTSDAPILSPDWRQEIAAADEWMGPAADERVRMETLLRCYTVNPARQDGAAAWKGTLLPGMAADMCVLAADPMTVRPRELPDVDVDLTVLAGTVVHDRYHPEPITA